MCISLPEVVQTYFDISNGGDIDRLASCFSADAVVSDEKRTHQGGEAIVAWQREVREAFDYRVEPLEAVQEGERLNVRARVVGNFPGSPVDLHHVFLMQEGRIRSLEIA